MAHTFTTVLFLGFLIVAAATDLRERRIRNLLTVPGLALGLVLSVLPEGITLSSALLGVGAAALVGLPLFALGAFGGGDAKLLLLVGAFTGPGLFLSALFLTILAGAALALHATVRVGMLSETVRSMGSLALFLVTFGRWGRRVTLYMPGAITIPYGLAIAIGATAAWFGGS
jgi:prepilin peptidase CpaA